MVLYVVLGLVLALYLLVRPRRGGPGAPPVVDASPVFPIPLLGPLLEFFHSPNAMVQRCYERYGPVFTISIFHKRLTFLIGPEAQEIFFKASDDVLSQQQVYDFMTAIFGKGIIYDATKKRRQTQFQSVSNGLRAARLKSYVPKIEEETRRYLAQEWGTDTGPDGKVVDILKALSELTILTASRCLHGEDVRQFIFKEVQELYHEMDKGLTPLTVFWPHAPTEAHRRRDAARKEMVRLFAKVIEEREANPDRSDGTDILELFRNITYKDGAKITTEEVTGLLIALLFAGQHTSCITSTWTSLFIANDPKWLDRVRDEQKTVLQDLTRKIDYDDLQQMEVLHNCMREALRLCPTFIMILRRAEKNITIKVEGKSFNIPKNDFVVVSPTVSMRLKSTFPDPDTFDPDRFAEPREEHKIPYAYLGFGGGSHSCMGQNFAFVQVKTILSIIFREYDIERVAPNMPRIGYDDMVVGPKGDCRVRIRKRVVK